MLRRFKCREVAVGKHLEVDRRQSMTVVVQVAVFCSLAIIG